MRTRLLKNSMSVIVFGALLSGLAACNTTGSSNPKSVSAVDGNTPVDAVDGNIPIDKDIVTSSIIPTINEATPLSNEACPPIEILDGTATLTAYAGEGAENPENTLHQAVFIKTNRECTITDNVLSLNISAAGRVAKGPKSFSDNATLPIRIAVVSGENDVLFSQLYNQLVHFPNEGRTQFSIVEESISVPYDEKDNLKILIGFDTIGSDEVASNPNEKSAG